jgi:hypothetical protein
MREGVKSRVKRTHHENASWYAPEGINRIIHGDWTTWHYARNTAFKDLREKGWKEVKNGRQEENMRCLGYLC